MFKLEEGWITVALMAAMMTAAQRRAENAQDELGRTLNNMGEVLLLQGRLPEAAATFRESLGAMTTQVYKVDAHLNIGLVQQAQGHLDEARASYQAALDLALEIERREVLPEAHYRLGEALRRLGEAEAALLHFRAGAEIIEATRKPLHDEGLKISLLGRWQQVYEALVLHCLALGQDAEAFDWAERARARAFAEAVGGGEIEKVAAAGEIWAGLPEGAVMLCYFTTGVLNREIPLLQALSVGHPLREHLLTPARTVLFALTQGRLLARECSLDPNALASASPRHGDRHQFLAPAILRRLHQALLEPVDDALTAKSLYLIPHGPLHLAPFGALTDSQGQPLVGRVGPVLAYAPSATVLVRYCLAPAPAPSSPATCLAVGYEGAPKGMTGERAALRYTETEAQAVAQLLGGVAWIGPGPKRERLRAAAAGQRWLHFACHGRFNPDEPMESYLETGAGERLTAREILQDWRLPHAELVTLSACQTGVSRVLRSDEPMGLIRAFLSAGARAVLVTQWPVEDLPAFLLIRHFYGELQRGEQASAALRAAQVWLRELTTAQAQRVLSEGSGSAPVDEPDPFGNLSPEARPFGHPRQWAAFILVGA
jgi:CHAT domain-containing protein